MPHRPTNRCGFSLLEALVAVALAALILVLAAAAVRNAAQTLRTIQTTAEENALLQRGWLEAMQDADYWLTHASPDFPYLAGPMSAKVEVGAGKDTDHPWDKRPFRPVTFRTGANPGDLLPHDPKAWYRGNTITNTTPVNRPAPNYLPTFTIAMVPGDPIVGQVKNDGGVVIYPAGWTPWHIAGDYAAMTRALALGDGSTEFADTMAGQSSADLHYQDAIEYTWPGATAVGSARVDGLPNRRDSDYLPSIQWWLFSELGHTGAEAYMPSGTLQLINRPGTNRTTGNIGNASKFFNIGEVPWATASGGPSGSFSAQAFTCPSVALLPGFSSVRRRNMLIGQPGSGNGLTAVAADKVGDLVTGAGQTTVSSRYINFRSGFNNCFATDYETTASRAIPAYGNWNDGDKIPHALFYPGRAFRIGSGAGAWDANTLIDRTVEDPFRLLFDDNAVDVNDSNTKTYTRTQTDTAQRMWNRFKHATQLQPAVATDDDRRPDSFGDAPQLQTTIVRYRSNYADRTRVTIIVHNPRTGSTVELPTMLIATSYRGARMHWGWKSQVRSDLPAMGDRYAP